jgi:hypothetical protein
MPWGVLAFSFMRIRFMKAIAIMQSIALPPEVR